MGGRGGLGKRQGPSFGSAAAACQGQRRRPEKSREGVGGWCSGARPPELPRRGAWGREAGAFCYDLCCPWFKIFSKISMKFHGFW